MTIDLRAVAETLKVPPSGMITVTLDASSSDDPDLSGRSLALWLQPWTTETLAPGDALVTATPNTDDEASGIVAFSFDAAAVHDALGSAVGRVIIADGALPWVSMLCIADVSGAVAQTAVTLPVSLGAVTLHVTLSAVASSGGGVTVHNDLSDRDAVDGHPIAAITGLQTELDDRVLDSDARLTDARTPTAHASTHATAGADPITPAAIGAQPAAEKDQPSGYAGLDGSGKLATSVLPALAIGETFTVASEVAMLALTAQQGDVAVRSDTLTTWILSGIDPSVLGDWTQLATPTDAVLSVTGQTGVVSLVPGDIGAATAAQGTAADNALPASDARVLPTPVGGTDGHVATIASGAWTIAAASGGSSIDEGNLLLMAQVFS